VAVLPKVSSWHTWLELNTKPAKGSTSVNKANLAHYVLQDDDSKAACQPVVLFDPSNSETGP
jgi:hypothetical protein